MYTATIAKTETINVNFDNLPEVSQRFLIQYGLQQKLADAGASKKTTEEKVEAAMAMLAKLEAGDLTRAAKASVDPLEAEIDRIARAELRKLLKSANREDIVKDEEAFDTATEAFIAKHRDRFETLGQQALELKRAKAASAKTVSDALEGII